MTSTAAATDRALIEAMARRAEACEGETKRVLDARLAQLKAASGEKAEQTRAVSAATLATAPAPSPLAALLGHIASTSASVAGPEAAAATGGAGLKAIEQFRSTWTRLRVDQRLQQSRAQVPSNAGPLNSQRLLHQALTATREMSPEYLQRLMVQVEALLWVESAGLVAASSPGRRLPAAQHTLPGGRDTHGEHS